MINPQAGVLGMAPNVQELLRKYGGAMGGGGIGGYLLGPRTQPFLGPQSAPLPQVMPRQLPQAPITQTAVAPSPAPSVAAASPLGKAPFSGFPLDFGNNG
jgi:hypothetical protein